MAQNAIWHRPVLALTLAFGAAGCASPPRDTNREASFTPISADAPAAVECPWLADERSRTATSVAGASGVPPVQAPAFVPGCAIIRFTVAADGSVAEAALRAAAPLNDGPTALAAVRRMRFQPAPDARAHFVVRLSMRRDSTGRISITSDTPEMSQQFWDFL